MKLTLALSLLSPLCVARRGHLTSEAFLVTDHRRTSPRHLRVPRGVGGSRSTSISRGPFSVSPRSSSETALSMSSLENRFKRTSRSRTQDDRDKTAAPGGTTTTTTFLSPLRTAAETIRTDSLSFSERELGLLVLFTVPVVWGTYASTVQSIYTLEPQVPGFLFSTGYFMVAALGSLAATFWNSSQKRTTDAATGRDASKDAGTSSPMVPVAAGLELGFYVYLANFLHVIGLQSVPSDRAGFLFQLTTVMVPMLEAFFARDLLAIPPSTWFACAMALTGIFVMGLEWPLGGAEIAPTATAAMQTFEEMTAFVPEDVMTADTTSGMGLPSVEASSLVQASAATTTTSLDTSLDVTAQTLADSSQVVTMESKGILLDTLLSGDTLIVAAAFLYAMQIIRISKWSVTYTPLQIMTGKTVAESLFSILFLGATVGLANSGTDASSSNAALQYLQGCGRQSMDFFHAVSQGMSDGTISPETMEHFTGACLWTGLVTTCFLVYAQSFGQQHVKASDANLIYSLQPLFTAIFAYYIMGETLQPMGYVGGALIGGAVYLVASKSLVAK